MATIWSSSAAVTGAIRLRGGVKSATFSCQSCTTSDVDNYDNDVYRDLLAEAVGSSAGVSISAAILTKTTEAGTTSTATNPSATSFDDRVSHTPPKPTAKKRTIMLFWTAGSGSGNVVASCWADEFMGFGPEFDII